MNTTKFILCMGTLLTLGLAPMRATAGNAGMENGETVICRGQEAHTSGPMVKVGQQAPDFRATNADLQDVSLSSFKGETDHPEYLPQPRYAYVCPVCPAV